MEKDEKLEDRIKQLLSRREAMINQRVEAENAELAQIERLEKIYISTAADLFSTIIQPKLKMLEKYFDDALYHPPVHGEIGIVEFNRDRRFDASISLELGIEPDARFQHLLVIFRLHILPIFMEFQSQDKIMFLVEAVNKERFSQFIDDKIAYVVETYMRLQEDIHYQKPCVEIDPVCNKSVDCNTSTSYAVFAGSKYYFCSVKCRDAFLDEPERYS